jgi:elongation factor Ts
MSTPTTPTPISAALVKELRERTSAGMMECKRALEESQGDIEKAIKTMREKGLAKAEKRAGHIAAEGIIVSLISADKKHGILMEINSETDFVARADDFIHFAQSAAKKMLSEKSANLETALTLKLDSGETIEETRRALLSKLGENIQIRRFVNISSNHQLVSYVHGNRIGALVDIEGGDEVLGKDIAMHIVASHPLVVSPKDVPEDLIQKEKDIFSAQAANSGKPANIIEKMVHGRIQKFLDEVSLLGQPFVKNPDETIGKLLDQHKAKIYSFTRYAVGEGIEKKVTDFAQEVMAQVRGS